MERRDDRHAGDREDQPSRPVGEAGVGIDGRSRSTRVGSARWSYGRGPRTDLRCGRRSGLRHRLPRAGRHRRGRSGSCRWTGRSPLRQRPPPRTVDNARIPYRPMASTTKPGGQSGVSGKRMRSFPQGMKTVSILLQHLQEAGLPDETTTDAQPSATACGNWQTVSGSG